MPSHNRPGPPAAAGDVRTMLELGLGLQRQGRLDEAARVYSAVLERDAGNADASHLLGMVALSQGRADEAIQLIGRALAVAPDAAAMYANRARALSQAQRHAEAVADCDQALRRDPGLVDAHLIRGEAMMRLQRLDEALASYEAAAGSRPAAAQRGAGNVLYAMGRFEKALSAYDKATALEPGNALGHFNRGNTLRVLKAFEAAIASYEAGIAQAPGFAVAHHNRALCLLHLGRLAEGFEAYEWRRRCPTFDDPRYRLPNAWTGAEPLAGRTLFIFPELFQGDLIQFCRYARTAERQGARVILGAPRAMHRLLRTLSPGIELVGEDVTPQRYDLQCALMSLPRAFGARLETLPGEVSYLSPELERVARWKERIGEHGLKVGIVWQGSTLPYSIPLQRSFPLAAAQGLADVPGVRLISLQKFNGLDQLGTLPPGMRVESLGDDFDPGPDAFVDTAAAMACCDMVVTVDTSVAHLAGALGVPGWVVLPYVADWRWLSDRPDCPWYPSLRLFRQAVRGEWGDAFAEMSKALRDEAAQRLT
jgi:Tfp pilus assembly protein PilF